ncbi:MAG: serine/threonine protein kinase, bacterial [Pyrinomonadaceae bacterium]|nr:serine/threonine protein kinase, bacterial [Pyrinomonadaceae bacterium]
MSSCPKCGAEVTPSDRFCGDCGTPLAQGTGAPAADAVSSPSAADAAVAFSLGAASAPAFEPAPEPASENEPDEERERAAASASAPVASAPPEGERAIEAAAAQDESAPLEGGRAAQAVSDEPAPVSAEQEGVVESSTPEPGVEVSANATGTGSAVESFAESKDLAEAGGAASPSGTAGDVVSEGAAHRTGETVLPSAESKRVTGGEGSSGSVGGNRTNAVGGTSRSGSTGRLRHQAKQLDPGTILYGRYEIVRRIGGGGMGAVYLAKDRNLGDQPRAVKEMIQSNIDESQHEKAINDFKRESMLLAALEHSSIPTIYDYFYDDEAARFYLVMKYISGGDFLARLRNAPGGRIDEKTVTDWACQVADVLEYLHRRNPPIIYRDLKPANLMIDGNSGRVMLIDFGIARWVSVQEKGVTAVGTMGYAPPELFSGKVEPRSDIYSLGATMFHLLTGTDPQDNPLLIFDFNKNPRPRQIAPSLSNEMEAILMRAVGYKPEDRFRSAAELRDALSAHLEKLRAGAVTYGAAQGDRGGMKTMQVEMVYCGFCGGRIAYDDVYCAHCGQRQPLAVASAALRTARATAKLVVMGTTELDSSFQLHKESSHIGRSDPHSQIFPEVDLSKFDPQTKISRRHARIFRKGDVYLVEDLGSVNGTVLNDNLRLAPHQPRALESGDKLRLGETTLHFLIG